jgi:hypothetical protein
MYQGPIQVEFDEQERQTGSNRVLAAYQSRLSSAVGELPAGPVQPSQLT